MESKEPIPDTRLAIGCGSAWHLLRCLGWQRERFTSRIASALGASSLTWLDFPTCSGKQIYSSRAPIRDAEWTGINFCGDDALKQAFADFWPSTGMQQNWDAIGRAVIDDKEEWIMVEAKAHSAEVSKSGTGAAEHGGRPMIRKAFKETLEGLGYAPDEAERRAEDWLTGYYQNANRLATLHFFSKNNIPARLVFLYFCGDSKPADKPRPGSASDWQPLLDDIHASLGLPGTSELEKRVHEVFMPVTLVETAAS